MNLQINTKFNVEDRIFFLSDNTPADGLINSISTHTVLFEGGEQTIISYGVEGFTSQIRENRAFETQNELADSLRPKEEPA